jgi:hypothetical protein
MTITMRPGTLLDLNEVALAVACTTTAVTQLMTTKNKAASPEDAATARAIELVDFLEDVALGKRKATELEVAEAQKDLRHLLSDAKDQAP